MMLGPHPSPLSPALVSDNGSDTFQETRAEGKEDPLEYGDFCDISSYPIPHEDCTPVISERGMSNFAKKKNQQKKPTKKQRMSIWWKSIDQFHGGFVSQILECGWESQASQKI